MKRLGVVVVFITLMSFIACSGDDGGSAGDGGDGSAETLVKKYPTRISLFTALLEDNIENGSQDQTFDISLNFEYNESNQIVRTYSANNSDPSNPALAHRSWYNEEGEMSRSEAYGDNEALAYADNLFYDSEGRLSYMVGNIQEGGGDYGTKFMYNEENQLINTQSCTDSNCSSTNRLDYVIDYDTTQISFEDLDATSLNYNADEVIHSQTFSNYDDKRAPFSALSSNFKVWAFSSINVFFLFRRVFLSDHNPRVLTWNKVSGNVVNFSLSAEIEYDADDYPTKITYKDDNGTVWEEMIISYQ